MRVILMHNPSAGSEDHSADQLIDELTRAGHQVIAAVGRFEHLASAIRSPCDLVAVAGGDGTVGKASEVLTGTGVPFAVLALGTANNIALALNVGGTIAEQIAAWDDAEVTGMDAAVARVGAESARFIEAFGFGAFPDLICEADGRAAPEEPAEKLNRDVELFLACIVDAPLQRFEVSAEGRDLSGDYLLVEALNIPSIGPNVGLVPSASFSDGKLDLVVAGEPERELLRAGLDRLRKGEPAGIALPSRLTTQISIAGDWRHYHRDGDLCDDRTGRVEIQIEHHALQVLVPRPARRT